MGAIFLLRDGKPVEMVERPFANEQVLHDHLKDNPELLSAEAAEDERRSWLLVKSEMGVPDREGGPDHFSLDLLLVDQDAIPTFVEVKRAKNREIRRMVVGQMLDYAANASAYWDAERLRDSFRSNYESAESADHELSEFIEDEYEPEEFWEAVAANLEERRLRLIFAADRIPRELRSIVEFLNEQLNQAEVIAVEVKQYLEAVDGSMKPGGRVNIVPSIIGETEMARRVKRADPGRRRRRATATEFHAEMEDAYEPELAERVLALYEHARAHATRHKFGRGKSPSAIVWLGENEDPDIANPVALRFGRHHVSVMTRDLLGRRTPAEMARLAKLLGGLPGTTEVLDDAAAKDYRTFCHFPTEVVLATDKDLDEFKRVLDEAAVRGGPTD